MASGDAPDDVSVSRSADVGATVEVTGQALAGAPGPCAWDENLAQLACPVGTAITLQLGAGDDALTVDGDVAVTAFGDAGNDVLDGATEAHGGEGQDTVSVTAGAGPRRVSGDAGDDAIEVAGSAPGPVDVVLDGGDGRDVLDASALSGSGAVLNGGPGADSLRGAAGVAVLDGGDDDDEIEDPADLLFGQDGRDRLDGGSGDDNIVGGPGLDLIDGGPGDDDIQGGIGS